MQAALRGLAKPSRAKLGFEDPGDPHFTGLVTDSFKSNRKGLPAFA